MATRTAGKICLILILILGTGKFAVGQKAPRWSQKAANDWYAKQPWLVGSNYTPATAINELEMWQADTFDPKRIDLELGWAESIGLNTMRVFLHDLPWQQDAAGFRKRIDICLQIADRHHIPPLFVLFDSCWDPNPQLGKQHDPRPGIHLVAGKTQTYLPWDSWQHPYTDREPAIWFHEIFRNDGTAYDKEELEFIREIVAVKPNVAYFEIRH